MRAGHPGKRGCIRPFHAFRLHLRAWFGADRDLLRVQWRGAPDVAWPGGAAEGGGDLRDGRNVRRDRGLHRTPLPDLDAGRGHRVADPRSQGADPRGGGARRRLVEPHAGGGLRADPASYRCDQLHRRRDRFGAGRALPARSVRPAGTARGGRHPARAQEDHRLAPQSHARDLLAGAAQPGRGRASQRDGEANSCA